MSTLLTEKKETCFFGRVFILVVEQRQNAAKSINSLTQRFAARSKEISFEIPIDTGLLLVLPTFFVDM